MAFVQPLPRVLPSAPPWLVAGAALVSLYPLARIVWSAPFAGAVAAAAVFGKLLVEAACLLWASGRGELPARLRAALRVLGLTSLLSATTVLLLEVIDWRHLGLPTPPRHLNQHTALASYLLYLVGFAIYPRFTHRREDAPVLWLDFMASIGGLGVLQWLLLTWPLLASTPLQRPPVTIYGLAFVLATAGLNVLIVWGRRLPTPRAFWWFVGGVAAYLPVTFLAQLEMAGVIGAQITSLAYFWGLIPTMVGCVLMRRDPVTERESYVPPTWWRTFNPVPLWTVAALGVTLAVAVWRGDLSYTALIAVTLLGLAVLLALRAQLTSRENARLRREEAEAAARLARVKTEAIGRLAGGIAHEFNNLMTTVLGFAELSEAELSPKDPVQEHLHYIRTSAVRAATLTRQLLQYSGQQVNLRRPFDLAALLRGLAPALDAGPRSGTRLSLDVCESVIVHGDPDQITQLLHELIANSTRAMAGDGAIHISLSPDARVSTRMYVALAPPAGACTLAVRDSGCGMAPDVVPRIFDPFYTTAPPPGATGLGLSSVYGIVAAHGGGIGVDTVQGAGTTIYVYLPSAA